MTPLEGILAGVLTVPFLIVGLFIAIAFHRQFHNAALDIAHFYQQLWTDVVVGVVVLWTFISPPWRVSARTNLHVDIAALEDECLGSSPAMWVLEAEAAFDRELRQACPAPAAFDAISAAQATMAMMRANRLADSRLRGADDPGVG